MEITHDNVLTLRLPYREKLNVQRAIYRGGDGTRVAVVSGIHGDELEGLYVCHAIARWLEALVLEHPDALLGQVELYPAANPLGLDTLERFDPSHDVDLNRSFPGHPEGLMPQRMAYALLQALDDAALVVDIHASNIYLREIPQVRINQDSAVISERAGLFVSPMPVGRWVQAGEVLGQLYDACGGAVLEDIKAPVAGLLARLRRQPLLVEGDLVVRLQTREPLPEDLGTFFYGQ